MAFHQLSFIKLMRLNFIGACIILIIYLIFNNTSMEIGKIELPPFPKPTKIKKLDVSRGEDFWFLTDASEVTY